MFTSFSLPGTNDLLEPLLMGAPSTLRRGPFGAANAPRLEVVRRTRHPAAVSGSRNLAVTLGNTNHLDKKSSSRHQVRPGSSNLPRLLPHADTRAPVAVIASSCRRVWREGETASEFAVCQPNRSACGSPVALSLNGLGEAVVSSAPITAKLSRCLTQHQPAQFRCDPLLDGPVRPLRTNLLPVRSRVGRAGWSPPTPSPERCLAPNSPPQRLENPRCTPVYEKKKNTPSSDQFGRPWSGRAR